MSLPYNEKISTAKLLKTIVDDPIGQSKINNIMECLNEGADVNERFMNDSNNTLLHISVKHNDIGTVDALLRAGAKINSKNDEGKSALDIAREMKAQYGSAMVELFEAFELESQIIIDDNDEPNTTEMSVVKHDEGNPNLMYQKCSTASGIEGQLYESKLLSLVLIRASLDNQFEEFYLGTSLDGIGALDDLCLRYKAKNEEGVLFLQAKHRTNIKKSIVTLKDLWKDEGDFSLLKYYNSFLQIKNKFSREQESVFFKPNESLKYAFIIYTPAESDFEDKMLIDADSVDKTTRDLVSSGDYSNIFRYKYNENDIDSLIDMLVIENMKEIGKILAKFIGKGKYDMLLNDASIKKYHVMLARYVINVSDLTPNGYRVGTFRDEFLYIDNDKLTALKLVLYKEFILAKKPNAAKMKEIIEAAKTDQSEKTLSEIMQNALTKFDEKNALVMQDDRFKDVTIKMFRLELDYETYSAAFKNAVNKMFKEKSIKLPATFGNLDIVAKERRLAFLADKIEQYAQDCSKGEPPNMEPSVLELNGGIGSAVGNLLILNKDRTFLVLNDNEQELGKNAKMLLEKLKSKNINLDDVKFNPVLLGFPCLTLDGDAMERNLVSVFFDNLWFYMCQSKEDEIEEYGKEAIQDYYFTHNNEGTIPTSNARFDAIYFIIHDAVQRWWMKDEEPHYLTNNKQFFDNLLKEFSGKSFLNVISTMFINRMRKYDIKYNMNAVNWVTSQIGSEVTIIITEVNILTGIKLVQCFYNINNYAFIDLNYVTCFSGNDYKTLIQDLKYVKLIALVILYEDITEAKNTIFRRLIDKSITNNYILVTNEKSAEKLKLFIDRNTTVTLRDVRNDLNDLDHTSQKKVLDNSLTYQGVMTKFSKILTNETKNLIKSKVLQKIINNEKIDVGKTLTHPYYEGIKQYYVHRKLRRQNYKSKEGSTAVYPMGHSDEVIKIRTLESLNDTVIIEGAPGMGKSTLLTYLSIETKKSNPSIWIERINLLDQTKELTRLQENRVQINKIDALKFVCKSALSRNLVRFCIKPIPLPNFDLEIENGEVALKNYDDVDFLVVFELKMLISCYNQGNTIFLFDGFDEICPHYKKEMTEILRYLVIRWSADANSSAKQRMWITGRSYNNLREILQSEFSVSYNLETFTNEDKESFIDKYFKINMNVNKLNIDDFKRIDGLFNFMKQFIEYHSNTANKKIIKLTSVFLYLLYITAMKYFYVEISNAEEQYQKDFWDKWSIIFNINLASYIFVGNSNSIFSKQWIDNSYIEDETGMNTPLHIFIVLDYFQDQIKNLKSRKNDDIYKKWDLDMNTSSFYEHFIETKLKRIRFEEQNQMDIYNPDIIMTYEKELKEFMDKHKKLAFFASFKEHLNEILTQTDIEEMYNIIQDMEDGKEKSGVIDCILNDSVPKFVHLSFQEYLAVDYISDLLKATQVNKEKLWMFILSRTGDGILDFFDRKLEFDYELMNLEMSVDVKEIIFEELILDVYFEDEKDVLLERALNLGLKYLIKMFLNAIADIVNSANLDDFIELVNKYGLFYYFACLGWNEVLIIILDCIKRVNSSKLSNCKLGVIGINVHNDSDINEIIRDVRWKITRDNYFKSMRKVPRSRWNSI